MDVDSRRLPYVRLPSSLAMTAPPAPADEAGPDAQPPAAQTTPYARTIRELSDRIVEAQRPIRILDAVKWDDSVRAQFLADKCRKPPAVNAEYYAKRPLGFDPAAKRSEFHEIERDITRRLGQFNPVSRLMRRNCREYQSVVRMLEARGTAEFSLLSQELYGSAGDAFYAGEPTLADLGKTMMETLGNLESLRQLPGPGVSHEAEQTVLDLRARLQPLFAGFGWPMHIEVSDGIIADAAAGSDYIKIRRDGTFTERDVRVLEVHEGWVHVGTTFNGLEQPVCTFLSKGPPSSTITQEGLAVIVEIMSLASHPDRLRRLANRVLAVDMVENGADFLQVFAYFREQGASADDSFTAASRIFRGSLPDAGPFTKDICYNKGFILIYNYLRLAVRRGLLDRIPLLFCGKVVLEDLRTLADLRDEGILNVPRFVPPTFADPSGLVAWLSYSNFLNRLDLSRVEADYANIL